MGRRAMTTSGSRAEAILKALELGCTREAAAGAAGISRVTLWQMMKRDLAFASEVEKAEDRAEAAMTFSVTAAIPKNWTAAAWWLERRRYGNYARHDKVDMTVDISGEAKRLAASLGLDEASVLAEAEAILAR